MDADKTADQDSTGKQRRRLWLIGALVLVFGISGAGTVYWKGLRSEDSRLEDYFQAQIRAESRQMGILYGKLGVMAEDLTQELKRPATQAQIIAVCSILLASGFFYFARRLHDGNETR